MVLAHPGSIPNVIFFSLGYEVVGKEFDHDKKKLHDLASPSWKNQVSALPSKDKRSISARYGKKDLSILSEQSNEVVVSLLRAVKVSPKP